MIEKLPDLAVLEIVKYLKLPDILNLVKCNKKIRNKIKCFKKNFYLFSNKEKINYIFTFDLDFLETNHTKILNELTLLRNSYLIDYTCGDVKYNNYICYMDSKNWYIVEYYLYWFLRRQHYVIPDFCDLDFVDDKEGYFGTIINEKPELIFTNDNVGNKIINYILPNPNFKSKIIKNNFNILQTTLN